MTCVTQRAPMSPDRWRSSGARSLVGRDDIAGAIDDGPLSRSPVGPCKNRSDHVACQAGTVRQIEAARCHEGHGGPRRVRYGVKGRDPTARRLYDGVAIPDREHKDQGQGAKRDQ